MTADLPGVDTGLIADDNTVETLELLSTDLSRDIAALRASSYDNGQIAHSFGLDSARVVENAMDHQRRRLRTDNNPSRPDREERTG